MIGAYNIAITQIIYQMIYLSEPHSKRFNLFLRCISVVPYLRRFSDSDFQNEWFLSFFICGRASSG